MSNFYFINQNAARTLFPEAAKSSNLDPLAFDLAYALERKNARLPKSDPMNGRDVKVLTNKEIASFDKQKKEITATRALKGDLALSTLFITAAAVAALAVGFYFFPVILFAAAIGLGALAITLGGLALHRHIQYNKKIDALANAVFPVRHQLALAKNFGKADPVKFLQEISCDDLELLSIAAHTASHSTDLGLLKDLISETQAKRTEGQIEDAILLPLYKFTSQLLNSSKKSDHLTKDGKPSAPIVLNFYKDVLNELSANPIPKKLSTLFGVQIVNLLCSSELMLKKGANPVEMTKMMQYINQNELQQVASHYVSLAEKTDADSSKGLVRPFARDWQNQMKFVAEGNTFDNVKDLHEMLTEKMSTIMTAIETKKAVDVCKGNQAMRSAINACQEAVLSKIKKEPSREAEIMQAVEDFSTDGYTSIEAYQKDILGIVLAKPFDKAEFANGLVCKDDELIDIAADNITTASDLTLFKELVDKTDEARKAGQIDDQILIPLYRSTCGLLLDSKKSNQVITGGKTASALVLDFYKEALNKLSAQPLSNEILPHFGTQIFEFLSICEFQIRNGANAEEITKMFNHIYDENILVSAPHYLSQKPGDETIADLAAVLGNSWLNRIQFVGAGRSFADMYKVHTLFNDKLWEILDDQSDNASDDDVEEMSQIEKSILVRKHINECEKLFYTATQNLHAAAKEGILARLTALNATDYASTDAFVSAVNNILIKPPKETFINHVLFALRTTLQGHFDSPDNAETLVSEFYDENELIFIDKMADFVRNKITGNERLISQFLKNYREAPPVEVIVDAITKQLLEQGKEVPPDLKDAILRLLANDGPKIEEVD